MSFGLYRDSNNVLFIKCFDITARNDEKYAELLIARYLESFPVGGILQGTVASM